MLCLSFLQKITKLLTKCIQGGEWVLITKIYSGVFYAKKKIVYVKTKNYNFYFLFLLSNLRGRFFLLLPDVKGVCMMWSGVSVVGILRKIKSQVFFFSILCFVCVLKNFNIKCKFLLLLFQGIFFFEREFFFYQKFCFFVLRVSVLFYIKFIYLHFY